MKSQFEKTVSILWIIFLILPFAFVSCQNDGSVSANSSETECLGDFDCHNTSDKKCDPSSGKCVGCLVDADCDTGAGESCNNNKCVTGGSGCIVDADCTFPTDNCCNGSCISTFALCAGAICCPTGSTCCVQIVGCCGAGTYCSADFSCGCCSNGTTCNGMGVCI